MHASFPAILLYALLITLLPHACAFADTLWVAGSAGGSALELRSVKVTGIADNKLLFQSAGRDTTRDLAAVARIQLDDEPAFSAAEEAFAAGKLDAAAKGYQALDLTRKPWLKARVASRLAQAVERSLPGGIVAIPVPPAQREAGAQPVVTAAAQQQLSAAAAALAKKDFPAARNAINANRAAFTDPQSQAQALYYLAEAQAGLAMPRSDTQSWQDVALAYMRVATHFPDSPLAPKALLQTAQIQRQQLSDPGAARSLYQQIVDQYPNDPATAAAREQLR